MIWYVEAYIKANGDYPENSYGPYVMQADAVKIVQRLIANDDAGLNKIIITTDPIGFSPFLEKP